LANDTGQGDKGTKIQDEFLVRMREQCQRIEQYRLAVMRAEGRVLSEDEAAREWIERYAGEFGREGSAS
jgi:hypothetical protein